MLKTSTKTTIDLPYELLSKSFDLDKHFLLQGIKNHRFLYAKVKEHDSKNIIVQERKGMYFSYTKYNNQTIVECYFPYGIISIFVWILLLVILLGFVLIPLIILLRYLLTKRNIKKIEENYERVFDYKNINSLNNQHNFSSPVNYNPLNNNLVNSDSKSIPPPFKGSHPNITPPPIHQDSIANKSIPPPIPRKTDYFIVFQGVQKGPLDINTLKEMIALKMIEENTLFWTEGMNDWKSIKEINLN